MCKKCRKRPQEASRGIQKDPLSSQNDSKGSNIGSDEGSKERLEETYQRPQNRRYSQMKTLLDLGGAEGQKWKENHSNVWFTSVVSSI